MRARRVYLYRIPVGFIFASSEELSPRAAREAAITTLSELLSVTPQDGRWLKHDASFDSRRALASMDEYEAWLLRNVLTSRKAAIERVSTGHFADFRLTLRNPIPKRDTVSKVVRRGKLKEPRTPEDAALVGIVEDSNDPLNSLYHKRASLNDKLFDLLELEFENSTIYSNSHRKDKKRKSGVRNWSTPADVKGLKSLLSQIRRINFRIDAEVKRRRAARRRRPKLSTNL